MQHTNEPTYLIGEYDKEGNFWCPGEYNSEEKARHAYLSLCMDYPNKHIVLVQQIRMHKVLDTHYPETNGNP